MEFKFNAQVIKAIEQELKKPLNEIISEVSVTNYLTIIKRGLFLKNEEEAAQKMQEYLKNTDEDGTEHSLGSLQIEIFQGLKDAYFLPQSVDLQAMRRQL